MHSSLFFACATALSQISRGEESYQDAVAQCEASNSTLGVLKEHEDSLEDQIPIWINVVKETYKNWRPDGEDSYG